MASSVTMDMFDVCGSPNLLDLPDELLLFVASHLRPIRSFETQSEAFKSKSREKERQCENSRRQKALSALCRCSRRLVNVFEPTLYSAFISTPTSEGLRRLYGFRKTLAGRPELVGHIEYIENRFSDYLGNSLSDELDDPSVIDMAADYFRTLAALICQASNVVHMCVVSLEMDSSLWKHLLPPYDALADGGTPVPLASHGFPQLQTLCLQPHLDPFNEADTFCFMQLFNALLPVPHLKQIYASSIISHGRLSVKGKSNTINTLQLFECMMELEEICNLLDACTALESFGCHWAWLDSMDFHLPDLSTALSAHTDTLRKFRLDVKDVRRTVGDFPLQPLGSLIDFTALITLELCERSLFAITTPLLDFPTQNLNVRLADLLPRSLETLIIRVHSENPYPDDTRIDSVMTLWFFAEDVTKKLPNLRELQIKSTHRLRSSHLSNRFRGQNIRFSLITEGRESF